MERWDRYNPEFTCGTLPGRHPDLLLRVLAQFDVENNPRYRAENGNTYCNVLVADALDALCVPPSHWWNGAELSANGLGAWFRKHGRTYGWTRADVDHARAAANAGRPVVAVWENPGGTGHVAMVLPTESGPLHIAQAGRHNLWDRPISEGFGEFADCVVFFAHP